MLTLTQQTCLFCAFCGAVLVIAIDLESPTLFAVTVLCLIAVVSVAKGTP